MVLIRWRGQLDNERRRMLRYFDRDLIEILKTKVWLEMSPTERERLLRYGQADAPFSLMFRAYLVSHGLTKEG